MRRHEQLDRAWLEAVELDDAREERDLATLPFPLLKWLFGHLPQPWEAFDYLPAEAQQKTWRELAARAEGDRS